MKKEPKNRQNLNFERGLLPHWVQEKLSARPDAQDLLNRHEAEEPWEYILGEISFYDCRVRVDQRALIPRCETELLVDLIVKLTPQGTLWDLCTGSGCIGIALKKHLPHLDVSLSDLSSDALSLALENCQINQIDLPLYQGDLLTPFQGKKADYIVCNPPYVSEEEYLFLDLSVKAFEPKMALVAKNRGLFFYQRLAVEALDYLPSGGQNFLDIGHFQIKAVKEISKYTKDILVIVGFIDQDKNKIGPD
ncbi:MAG: peptide chain release factor N(5)-glutamine methyltransferase, partial [Chlamydiia bacterium]|nr:peptide chain release factor N(5)-glutamine methyltransferase [Chlamydiia bacterium]